MSDLGGLQLLPETRKKIEISTPGQNRLLVWSLVLVAILVLVYVGMIFYRNSIIKNINTYDQQLQAIEGARDKKVETELISLGKQFSTIKPLVDSHILWSQALATIQRLAQPRIQFKNLTASVASKRVSFGGVADSYTTIAKQIAAFYGEDSITDLKLTGVRTMTDGKAEFTMEITFNPVKFLNKAKVEVNK